MFETLLQNVHISKRDDLSLDLIYVESTNYINYNRNSIGTIGVTVMRLITFSSGYI